MSSVTFSMNTIGKTKGGRCDILARVEPTQFIGMNSIVTDPVSDQTGCQAVCNGDDTGVNVRIVATVLRSELEMRNGSPYHQSLRAPVMNVPIDSRCMKMILPSDADRG
jgi:hypothetical protein